MCKLFAGLQLVFMQAIAMNFFHVLLFTVLIVQSGIVGGAKLMRKQRSVSGSYIVSLKSSTTDREMEKFMKDLKSLSDNEDTPHQASHMEGLYSISKGILAELNEDALEVVRLISLATPRG